MANLDDSICPGSICDEWDCSFRTSSHRQFHKGGRMQKCGPPILLDEEKKQEGYGFWGNLYCPYCGETSDFILIEFDNLSSGPSPVWKEISMEEWGEDFMKCPKCGYRDLEFVSE